MRWPLLKDNFILHSPINDMLDDIKALFTKEGIWKAFVKR